MNLTYYNRHSGFARTVIVTSGLALLSVALWFPRSSLLHGAGVLIALIVLVGVKNSNTTVATAWVCLSTVTFCIVGSFLANYDKSLSQMVSIVGVICAMWAGVLHLRSHLKAGAA